MKKENITCFFLGVILGGLLFISTDYPVYNEKINKAKLLCKDTDYTEARIDIIGEVQKITCKDGTTYLISKLNLQERERKER
jgi:hypothetical protein